MKALPNLIRVQRWRLDQQRRRVVELQTMRDAFTSDLNRLDAELERERAAAGLSNNATAVFPMFLGEFRARRARIEASIANVDREIEAAQDEATAAFQELKRYELALDAHNDRLAVAAARRDRQVQDEVALGMHRRGG